MDLALLGLFRSNELDSRLDKSFEVEKYYIFNISEYHQDVWKNVKFDFGVWSKLGIKLIFFLLLFFKSFSLVQKNTNFEAKNLKTLKKRCYIDELGNFWVNNHSKSPFKIFFWLVCKLWNVVLSTNYKFLKEGYFRYF